MYQKPAFILGIKRYFKFQPPKIYVIMSSSNMSKACGKFSSKPNVKTRLSYTENDMKNNIDFVRWILFVNVCSSHTVGGVKIHPFPGISRKHHHCLFYSLVQRLENPPTKLNCYQEMSGHIFNLLEVYVCVLLISRTKVITLHVIHR